MKKNSDGEIVRLGTFLDDVLSEIMSPDAMDLLTLEKNKAFIFPQKTIKKANLFALKDSTLFIKTASSVWRAEIYAKKDEIIDNCNTILGKKTVRSIKAT